MSLFANTFLELPQFIVTKESRISQKNKFDTEYFINTIHGKTTTEIPRECSHCNSPFINHKNLQD